jgi:hypothetical protein
MKRNVSVVCFKFRCNILISGKIIKEMPGSVGSGTYCRILRTLLINKRNLYIYIYIVRHYSIRTDIVTDVMTVAMV